MFAGGNVITAQTFFTQFAAFATRVGVFPMPMQVTNGSGNTPAGVVYGNPRTHVPQPLDSFVDLPYRYGAVPETPLDPDAAYAEYAAVIHQDQGTTDFQKGLWHMRSPALKARFEVAHMEKYLSEGEREMDRNELIHVTLRDHEFFNVDNPYSVMKLGFFFMCYGGHFNIKKAADCFMRAAGIYSNSGLHAAAAMSYELTAEVLEYYATIVDSVEEFPTSHGELEMGARGAHIQAAKEWMASLALDEDPTSYPTRLYRALYHAWFNPDRTDMMALLDLSITWHARVNNQPALANDLMRIAWFKAQEEDVDWAGVSQSIRSAASLWQSQTRSATYIESAIQFADAARGFAKPS